MKREIWYISKYAIHQRFGAPTRQYFFSKHFAQKGRNATLISSRSCGVKQIRTLRFYNHFTITENNLKSVLINGPILNLGFNPKRIYSWLVFEIRTMIWALFSRKEKPEVIIVSSLSILTFLTGSLLKKIYKCNLVCEVRDIWPLTIIEAKGWSPKNVFIRFLAYVEKVGYKNADVIIGTMPNLQEHVANVNIKFKYKVFHIPMGYDPLFYNKRKTNQHDPFKEIIKQKIPERNFIVGYAGTMGLLNHTEQIIEAASLLSDKSISFLLLGNGPLKKPLLNKVKEHNLNNVLFFDFVKKEQVQFFLQKCDLLLHPVGEAKIYKYGLSPNKWIDYMYSSRPFIVSYNGFQSIVNEANCGKFIKANNTNLLAQTILAFSKMQKSKLTAMGKRGKKYLEDNLSYNILSNRYLKIIDSI